MNLLSLHGQPRNEVAEDGIQEKSVDGGEAKTAADSGQQYEGDKDSDGKPHGRGKLIKTGEYEYEGEFCHGKFHGKGTFKDLPGDFERDGTFEDGTFVEGSFTKGDQVEHGQFQQNSHGILTLHGHGVREIPGGTATHRLEGTFEDGLPVGMMLRKLPNGNEIRQEYYVDSEGRVKRKPFDPADQEFSGRGWYAAMDTGYEAGTLIALEDGQYVFRSDTGDESYTISPEDAAEISQAELDRHEKGGSDSDETGGSDEESESGETGGSDEESESEETGGSDEESESEEDSSDQDAMCKTDLEGLRYMNPVRV